MRENQQILKLFVVLLFGTAFIFSFSHYGAKAFQNFRNADGLYEEGTTIGSLNISGKTEEEATSLLAEKFSEWLKGTTFELQYGEQSAYFDVNEFQLDEQQTIDSVKEGQDNPAYVMVESTKVEEQIQILFPELTSSDFDIEKLTNNLNSAASSLSMGANQFNLYTDYLAAGMVKEDSVISEVSLKLSEIPMDLQTMVEKTPSIDLPEGSTFSLLQFAKKQELTDEYALSVLATAIYQTILPSNFLIVERNISSTLPTYAKLGTEAKVDFTVGEDLSFSNPNKSKYVLGIALQDGELKVTLKGEQLPYSYEITTKNKAEIKPKTVIQFSPQLPLGNVKVPSKGEDGVIVEVYRDIYQGSSYIKSLLVSEDYYPPQYRVEIHSIAGGQQAASSASGISVTTDNSASTTNQTDNSVGQTNGSSDSDLWGKPNEEPK